MVVVQRVYTDFRNVCVGVVDEGVGANKVEKTESLFYMQNSSASL